jgi:DNA topoisomerase VI subunit B
MRPLKPHIHPADEPIIAAAFKQAVNLTAREIEAWLKTDESQSVGMIRRGESESVGRQSARKIIAILKRPKTEWTEADYSHMRKVVGYVKRHGAQRPAGDISRTRWRYSLMNWGHDPLKR